MYGLFAVYLVLEQHLIILVERLRQHKKLYILDKKKEANLQFQILIGPPDCPRKLSLQIYTHLKTKTRFYFFTIGHEKRSDNMLFSSNLNNPFDVDSSIFRPFKLPPFNSFFGDL